MTQSNWHRLSLLTPTFIFLSGVTLIAFLLWIIASKLISSLLFGISILVVMILIITKKDVRSGFQSSVLNIILNLLVFLLIFSMFAFLSLKILYISALPVFAIFIFYLIYLLYRYSCYRRIVVERVPAYESKDIMKNINDIWIILNRMDLKRLSWYKKIELHYKEIVLTTMNEKKVRININYRPDWKKMKGFFIEIHHSGLPKEIGDNFLNELRNEILIHRKRKISQNN